METSISSEISVTLYRSKRFRVPEKSNLYEDRCNISKQRVSWFTVHSNRSVQVLVE